VASLLLKSAIHRGIATPDQIETFGLSVYASIPKSAQQGQTGVSTINIVAPTYQLLTLVKQLRK
jgi:hypothetical protein